MLDNRIYIIEGRLDKIDNRYNPEFDCIKDGPRVTWAEAELSEAVRQLLYVITDLQKQITELRERK